MTTPPAADTRRSPHPAEAALAQILAQVLGLAADLAAEADLAPVGSDAYVDLHVIAARIRAAAVAPTTTETTEQPR
ncbi:hypothetical protein [Embleya sp. NPDC020630]|uniref:hypothetical protein n=1 Tax=Embleya sp. NPDC020630 TaxID=3363979 RepID=UPI0037B1AC49